MKAKLGVIFSSLLLLLFIVVAFQRGIWLIEASHIISKILGFSIIVIAGCGTWALCVEWRFGWYTQKLAAQLMKEDNLPLDYLPRSPGGRIIREAADEHFQHFKSEVEQNPKSWGAWFRLSCGYDMAGDRKRARRAMRQAIALFRVK